MNVLADPRARLVISDYETGGAPYLTAVATVDWDGVEARVERLVGVGDGCSEVKNALQTAGQSSSRIGLMVRSPNGLSPGQS